MIVPFVKRQVFLRDLIQLLLTNMPPCPLVGSRTRVVMEIRDVQGETPQGSPSFDFANLIINQAGIAAKDI
jgi:hypothetical protein